MSPDPPKPSPWLIPEREPQPHPAAGFVEYLRWMRAPDNAYKDGTKDQILQLIQDNADYRDRLRRLTQRTERMAGRDNTIEVKCPWRIRVGGHHGPENMLLPAFDALGMPYIPSSTLRGIARAQGIRETMARQNCDWADAEPAMAPYFGSLQASDPRDHAGKVVFFDAYPLPSKTGGLAQDVTNNIWRWRDGELEYGPTPNAYLSLQTPTFLIGLRLASGCRDRQVLEQVKQWLLAGLQVGAGSQINAGYGKLLPAGSRQQHPHAFLSVALGVRGQLIHGGQRFSDWQWNDRKQQWQVPPRPQAEVRPTAFKSMLRYWFRALARGVLPPERVQEAEATLFGGIAPQRRGYLEVSVWQGKTRQAKPKPGKCGEQAGVLSLAYSTEAPAQQRQAIAQLARSLTWLMLKLGGIGQGARRPCYQRQGKPRYRGSKFLPEDESTFWNAPESVPAFRNWFRQRLCEFYGALGQLFADAGNPRSPRTTGTVRREQWQEAIDAHCLIAVCTGRANGPKPYALALMHDHKDDSDSYGYLCGQVDFRSRTVIPSPVWIADLGDYQVVTAFGATQDPRRSYLAALRNGATDYAQLWPLA